MKMLERLTRQGWLSFFREIAIIAIGVLLALAAGEFADDWNWQRRVAAGELRLRSEAADNFNYFAEQVIVEPCVDQQFSSPSCPDPARSSSARPMACLWLIGSRSWPRFRSRA